MERRKLLEKSSQGLCLLCSSKIFADTLRVQGSRLPISRRSFKSYSRDERPPQAAVAEKDDETEHSELPSQQGSRRPSAWSGAFTDRSSVAKLTPEEERLRSRLQQQTTPALSASRQAHHRGDWKNLPRRDPRPTPVSQNRVNANSNGPQVSSFRRVEINRTEQSGEGERFVSLKTRAGDHWRKPNAIEGLGSRTLPPPSPRIDRDRPSQETMQAKYNTRRSEQPFRGFRRSFDNSDQSAQPSWGVSRSAASSGGDHGSPPRRWNERASDTDNAQRTPSHPPSARAWRSNHSTVHNQTWEANVASNDQDMQSFARPSRRRGGGNATDQHNRKSSSFDTHRGRDKDKARRRERFVTVVEEEVKPTPKAQKAERKKRAKSERASSRPTPILIPEFITVDHLARILKVRAEQFSSKLESLGFESISHDHILNAENAGLIAMEYNFEPILDKSSTEDLHARTISQDSPTLRSRPPVVTIMGHVDHGKTTILDWLRKSSIAASEHGGITQHIGAFSVPMPSGKIITFLDTPGHAAFLTMRRRGANVTDMVILVVAADDSVKPQTIEAIKHAKEADVPMIVAISKVDKPDANVELVKQDLARNGVEVEDFGGDTQVVCVSGKTGQGMETLEEAAVTLSEILDVRADFEGNAEGWILEATTKKAGRIATVLVRQGTLRVGDVVVAGSTWGRIRTLKNEAGIEVEKAGPGTPVEVDGWREQPMAGDEVLQAADENKAKSVVDFRVDRAERLKLAVDMTSVNEARRLDLERRERESRAAGGQVAEEAEEAGTGIKEVPFLVKGDVSGSVEAVLDSIRGLGNDEVRPSILRSGVGPVSEFDIQHAAAAQGHIIAFNVRTDPTIAGLAESQGVSIIERNIIYRLTDDVNAKLSMHLKPKVTERVVGEANILQVFSINVKGNNKRAIAGCKVRNGLISRSQKVRVSRGKEVIYDGELGSLKNVKKDVTEMRKGTECGMGFTDWEDFMPGDEVQCYERIVEPRTL
ncbi:MAG: hypothetical protein M1825_005060 [Sarcosagium campestre]|nr:MAG: hypothetical protein M1825_005060 [Sarcosagium campestre]